MAQSAAAIPHPLRHHPLRLPRHLRRRSLLHRRYPQTSSDAMRLIRSSLLDTAGGFYIPQSNFALHCFQAPMVPAENFISNILT